VHVAALCPANAFIDLSDKDVGATCKPCPSPASSTGGTLLACDNCPGIPLILPSRASIRSGCAVTCEGTYAYKSESNTCEYEIPGQSNDQARSDAAFVVIVLMIAICLMCCCCYVFKGPMYQQHVQQVALTRFGHAAVVTPQTVVRVRLSTYPESLMASDTQLPNNADCCVICLGDFKPGDRLRTLSCQHPFHVHCIDSWLDSHTTCPLCNHQLETVPVEGIRRSTPREMFLQRPRGSGQSIERRSSAPSRLPHQHSPSPNELRPASHLVTVRPARGVGVNFTIEADSPSAENGRESDLDTLPGIPGSLNRSPDSPTEPPASLAVSGEATEVPPQGSIDETRQSGPVDA